MEEKKPGLWGPGCPRLGGAVAPLHPAPPGTRRPRPAFPRGFSQGGQLCPEPPGRPGPGRPCPGTPAASGGRAGPSVWRGLHGGAAQPRFNGCFPPAPSPGEGAAGKLTARLCANKAASVLPTPAPRLCPVPRPCPAPGSLLPGAVVPQCPAPADAGKRLCPCSPGRRAGCCCGRQAV